MRADVTPTPVARVPSLAAAGEQPPDGLHECLQDLPAAGLQVGAPAPQGQRPPRPQALAPKPPLEKAAWSVFRGGRCLPVRPHRPRFAGGPVPSHHEGRRGHVPTSRAPACLPQEGFTGEGLKRGAARTWEWRAGAQQAGDRGVAGRPRPQACAPAGWWDVAQPLHLPHSASAGAPLCPWNTRPQGLRPPVGAGGGCAVAPSGWAGPGRRMLTCRLGLRTQAGLRSAVSAPVLVRGAAFLSVTGSQDRGLSCGRARGPWCPLGDGSLWVCYPGLPLRDEVVCQEPEGALGGRACQTSRGAPASPRGP